MQYVISDIHGRGDRFASILRQIDLQRDDHLYILGDVIDRNPHGIALLTQIMRMPNMTLLLGNHEYMMLDHLAHPDDAEKAYRWIGRNGGDVTMEAFERLTPEDREQLIAYLSWLPLNAEVTCGGRDWLLVHGAPVCMAPDLGADEDGWAPDTRRYYAVWHRITADEAMPEGKTVVFGHTPTVYYQPDEPPCVWYGKGCIGIDCGCAYPPGRLACLRLDDGKVFYSTDEV